MLRIESAASSGGPGKLTYLMYVYGLRLREKCWFQRQFFLFTRARKLCFFFRRCLRSVELRKKLPGIKHQTVHF